MDGLNSLGWREKPASPFPAHLKITGAMSVPRTGFSDNYLCASRVFHNLNIQLKGGGGVFWEKSSTALLQSAVDRKDDYIVFVDYDSLFDEDQLTELISIMEREKFDAVFPVQIQRNSPLILMTPYDKNAVIDLNQPYTRAQTGHFGLTILRCSAVGRIPHPWFINTPNMEGMWADGPGRADADIGFWCMANYCGLAVYQANYVRIGHMELTVTWPTRTGKICRHVEEFNSCGVPPQAKEIPSLEQAGGVSGVTSSASPPGILEESRCG